MARTRAQAAKAAKENNESKAPEVRGNGFMKRQTNADREMKPQLRHGINSAMVGQSGTKRTLEMYDDELDSTHKRPRRSYGIPPVKSPSREPAIAKYSDTNKPYNPIAFWAEHGSWPQQYAEPGMERILARKKSVSTLSRKRSSSALSATPSDQRPREEKSAPYGDSRYELLLQTKGTYMGPSRLGLIDSSKGLVSDLLNGPQPIPKDTIFDDSVFEAACWNLQDRNEARVIRDISHLIVPSAETVALRTESLRCLVESVNAGWNNSVPLTGSRPQPDYAVGFKRVAFSDEQLTKLSPFVGDFIAGYQSLFMGTYYIRATTELFRAVNREAEVNRQILAFSVSHDDRSVRIYGHYPVIEGKDPEYYRHTIHEFSITALDGKEKWTAYRFTMNLYKTWVPSHLKRICSAIDQLPSELNFDDLSLPHTALSQGLEGQHLPQSDATSLRSGEDVQSIVRNPETVTPSTSLTDQGTAKKQRSQK
ncbi:hypothetical protein F4777DRAFT_583634 [Nemania sp. FL0916]|nr:hypothetical protein F4777DRAFT_583634 [Nemania sp. FL0916]